MAKKPVVGVSEQLRHKPDCTQTRLHTNQIAHKPDCTQTRLHTNQIAH